MVGWKKFLLIPLFIILYAIYVFSLTSGNFIQGDLGLSSPQNSNAVAMGVGEGVGITVMRPYLFGLLTLPVYSTATGDISVVYDAFLPLLVILCAILVVWEWQDQKKRGKGGSYSNTTRGGLMNDFGKGNGGINQPKLLRSAGLGILGLIVCLVLSGDFGASLVLGGLLLYLEYNLK